MPKVILSIVISLRMIRNCMEYVQRKVPGQDSDSLIEGRDMSPIIILKTYDHHYHANKTFISMCL